MTIEVSWGKTSRQHFLNLSFQLQPNFIQIESTHQISLSELQRVLVKPSIRVDEGWDHFRPHNRLFLNEGEVDAQIQGRGRTRQLHCMIEGLTISDDGG